MADFTIKYIDASPTDDNNWYVENQTGSEKVAHISDTIPLKHMLPIVSNTLFKNANMLNPALYQLDQISANPETYYVTDIIRDNKPVLLIEERQ